MIKLSGVNKTYRDRKMSFQALKGVELWIRPGEMVAIMGRSGCGKTTLLNIIGLMDHMDSGEYLLEGRDVRAFRGSSASEVRNRYIGFVYQTFNLIQDLTTIENVEMPLGYAGVPRRERYERALEMLTKVDLRDKLKNRPSELSGGQRQRVAIARALVNHPKVILADEPTGNLDKKNGEDIMRLLSELNRTGVTVVVVTHDEMVSQYASRIIRMEDGMIL